MRIIIVILSLWIMNILYAATNSDTTQNMQDQIPALSQSLFHDAQSPVGGNLQGSVTLVEFFDYQCPHCREVAPTVMALRAANPNLRIVYKDWPIFGGSSTYAAKVGMAIAKQGKYEAFHDAVMEANLPLTNDAVLSIARSLGADMTRLQQDMANPAIDSELKATVQLAKQLQLIGTPAFIIAKTQNSDKETSFLVPGPASQSTLQQMISQSSGF